MNVITTEFPNHNGLFSGRNAKAEHAASSPASRKSPVLSRKELRRVIIEILG